MPDYNNLCSFQHRLDFTITTTYQSQKTRYFKTEQHPTRETNLVSLPHQFNTGHQIKLLKSTSLLRTGGMGTKEIPEVYINLQQRKNSSHLKKISSKDNDDIDWEWEITFLISIFIPVYIYIHINSRNFQHPQPTKKGNCYVHSH